VGCRFNVEKGPAVDKNLATGKHRVRDNFCKVCQAIIGWSYVSVSDVDICDDLIGRTSRT
jgi:hypothetical protein